MDASLTFLGGLLVGGVDADGSALVASFPRGRYEFRRSDDGTETQVWRVPYPVKKAARINKFSAALAARSST
jgi:hypothetical protein